MGWWWHGRAGKGAGGGTDAAPAARSAAQPAVSPAGWAFLPPLQRVIGDAPATTAPRAFPQQLPVWRNPSFTGRMSHVVSPVAPAGVVDADGGGLGAPSVGAPASELTLLLPATPVQRQAHRPLRHVTPAASPPAASGPRLTSVDPSPLPLLQLAAVPTESAPPVDQTGPDGPLPQVQLLSEPELRASAPDTVESGYDNGGATTVQLPMPPVQRSAAGPEPVVGRAPGTGPRPRLGLGAPLPPGPAPATRATGRHVQRAVAGPAGAAAPTLAAPAAPVTTGPAPLPAAADVAPAGPTQAPPERAVPVEPGPGAAGRPPAPLALAVQRSADEPSNGTAPPEATAALPGAALSGAPSRPEAPPGGEARQAALLGERGPASPEPHGRGSLAMRSPAVRMPVPASGPSASPGTASPAPTSPTSPTAPHLPLQRAASSVSDAPSVAPDAAEPAAAPVEQGPEVPRLEAIPVQRDVGVLAQRSLVPLVSAEISPTAPAVRPQPPERAAQWPQARPAVPITLLPPVAPAVPERHVATLTATPVQRDALAGPPVPRLGAPPTPGAAAATVSAAMTLPLGAFPPAVPVQRAAPDDQPPEPEPAPGPDAAATGAGSEQPEQSADTLEEMSPGTAPGTAAGPAGGAAAGSGTGTAESAPSQEHLDELARRLMPPLTRRLRAEMLIDRERRGLRSDPR